MLSGSISACMMQANCGAGTLLVLFIICLLQFSAKLTNSILYIKGQECL